MSRSRTGILDPAPPRPSGEGGSGRWAWLLTASGIIEAQLVRGVLETAGVPVVLDGRDGSPFAWMYLAGNVNAPVHVLVPASLLDAARLHLLDAGLEGSPPQTVGGSPEEPEAARRPRPWWRPILTVTAILVAGWIVFVTMLGRATCALGLFC